MQRFFPRPFLVAALGLLNSLLQAAEPLKVVAWNIEWFPGHRPTASAAEAEKHMKEAQAALKELDPDLFIGLEMQDWAAFHELVSVVPGLTTHVVSNFVDPTTGEIRAQQIGIASKLTCRGASWETWKANIPNISRGFSFAAIEQNDGSLLMVYGNHLKSNRGNESEVALMRNDQAKQLIENRALMEKAYTGEKIAGWILAGDFNTNHDGQFPKCHVVSMLTSAGYHNSWAGIPQENRLTWRGDSFGRYQPTTFDYLFTLGLGSPKAAIQETPRSISDHHAIFVELPQK
jgi:endonuclease/exonuclease/phosphatase family metal-dependent hydrolase